MFLPKSLAYCVFLLVKIIVQCRIYKIKSCIEHFDYMLQTCQLRMYFPSKRVKHIALKHNYIEIGQNVFKKKKRGNPIIIEVFQNSGIYN